MNAGFKLILVSCIINNIAASTFVFNLSKIEGGRRKGVDENLSSL
jgi:hypothetical protein